MSEITPPTNPETKAAWLAEAVKDKLVRDIEALLRAVAEPEFNRLLREAAVSAAEAIKVRLQVHTSEYHHETRVIVMFDGEQILPKPEVPHE